MHLETEIGWNANRNTAGENIFVADTFECSGGFMIPIFLQRCLKFTENQVVLVGIAKTYSHYAVVGKKLVLSLLTIGHSFCCTRKAQGAMFC